MVTYAVSEEKGVGVVREEGLTEKPGSISV